MDTLRVRVYNVRFGDGILISVPDRGHDGTTTLRHILIDVGNSWNKAGGINDVYKPVLENILTELDGKGLDLYVMTHEHMDHVEGLLYADQNVYNGTLKDKLGVKHAWLTASSAPDYYDIHPKAQELHLQVEQTYQTIASYLKASPEELPQGILTLLDINNLAGTDACVKFLHKLAPAGCTHYIHRGSDLTGLHDFQETKFEIWAPEEDTSVYYTRPLPMALNYLPAAPARGEAKAHKAEIITPVPLPGVDASAFYQLVEQRKNGITDNLMAIDKAENNTSVVFTLEWRGWRLLFAADAELRSWQIMQGLEKKILKPLDFLKVGHHGSINGTPQEEIFNEILPVPYHRERMAALSTFIGDSSHPQYHGVPDPDTIDRIKACCTLKDTRDVNFGKYIDIQFKG